MSDADRDVLPVALAPVAVLPGTPHDRARTTTLLIVPLITMITSAIGAALSPTLLVESPATLIALDPRPTNLVLAGPALSTATYFGIGVVRWFIADPFLFQVGKERGPAAIAWLGPRSGALGRWTLDVILRSLDRAAMPVLFLFPSPLVSLLVGVQQRMSLARFTVVNLAGTVVSLLVLRAFGDRFAGPIATFTALVADHIWTLTGITTVLVVVLLVARWRRRVATARVTPP